MPSTIRRVLVADDEAAFRQYVAECLVEEGFEVLEASNGLEALLQVKRGRPEALVLDLRMPRLGGLEVLRRVHTFDRTIRVLIVTGFPMDLRQGATAQGAAAVLVKPIEMSALLAALRSEGGPVRMVEPGVPPSANDVATARGSRTSPAPPVGSPRILIVDDDARVAELLREYFGRAGYLVDVALHGGDALTMIQHEPPDVVILDIAMPGMDGVEVLRRIRETRPGVPVIMATAHADVTIAQRTRAIGAFDHLTKPLDFTRLERVVAAAVAHGRRGEAV